MGWDGMESERGVLALVYDCRVPERANLITAIAGRSGTTAILFMLRWMMYVLEPLICSVAALARYMSRVTILALTPSCP